MGFTVKWKNPSGTKAYFAWRSMRARCYAVNNDSFIHYGGRGIQVCERWLNDYDAFYADMGEPAADLSLDRVDNNADYSPENCRWATVEEQLSNQRRSRLLTFEGKTCTLTQWAVSLGLSVDTLHKRLERMSLESALVAGPLRTWEHGTRAGYEGHGCRCDVCIDSNTKRHQLRRAKKRESLQVKDIT